MTTIAWDGTSLAADRRAVNANLSRTVTKIRRLHNNLVAYAGNASLGEEMVNWFRNGANAADFPAAQRDKEDWTVLVVVQPGGVVTVYERSPHPITFHDPFYAAGSGRDFALAAMRCGRTATKAVELASAFDIYTGNGVDTLTF